MKTIEELKHFYDREIAPKLLHAPRLLGGRDFIKLFIALFVVSFILMKLGYIFITMLLFFSSFIWMWWYTEHYTPKLKKMYQDTVIIPMLHEFDPTIKYIPERGISSAQIKASKFFNTNFYDNVLSNSLLTYRNGTIAVTLAYFKLTKNKTKQNDDNDYFEGLFCTTDARRPINGTTIVSFDFLQKHLGFVGEGIQSNSRFGGLQKVRLDSNEFEKEYLVYSTDSIEAHYILSFTVMDKLTQIVQKYRLYPYISFVGNKIYFAMFEPSFLQHQGGWAFEDIKQYFETIGFVVEAIEAIHHHHRV